MEQNIEILKDNKVKVTQGIMPKNSKRWNEGLDDKDRFKQIGLSLTFDLTGVIGSLKLEPTKEPSDLVRKAMDSYFIEYREVLKKEVAEKHKATATPKEIYATMKSMVEEWQDRIIKLPIIKPKVKRTSALKEKVAYLTLQKDALIDLTKRYISSIPTTKLFEVIERAGMVEPKDWSEAEPKFEAELMELAKAKDKK